MSRGQKEPQSCNIAIVGIACCYSRARTPEQFWGNIVNKVDAISDVPKDRIDPDAFYDPTPGVEDKIYCKKGGWLGSQFAFNPLKYGTMPRTVEGAEPDQFLVLRTVHEAIEDAGYINKQIDGKKVSIILGRGNYLGAGLSALLQRGLITQQTLDIIKGLHPELTRDQLDEIKASLRRSLPEFGAETAPGLIPNITTGRVANRLDFMGKNFTVDAACASSLISVELGMQGLISGQDDMVLAGGVHVFTNVPFLQVFAAMRALSPTSTIRPFDEHCDGTMPGEGVGILVLKRLEDAEQAGDRIYAVIKGIGSSSDGKAKSVTAPRVEGEELAVRRAYESSGIPPQSIELIEAHGTGTPVGDAAEVETLHRIFGSKNDGPPTVAVGSVKSMIGHAMPAAGAAGIIKTALALYHRVFPPTLNCRKPLPELVHSKSRFYVNTEARPWIRSPMAGPRRAGINAFGFGGVNAHMVLEEYKGGDHSKWRSLIRTWESELVVIEAETRDKLQSAVSTLRQYLADARWVELRDLAYTQNTRLTQAPFRVSIVAASVSDLKQKLERVQQRLGDPSCRQIKDSQGIFYFQETPLRQSKIALLFPGEGSQYLNMLSDLCIHFPEVRECFDLADEMVEDQRDRYAPSADIFPAPFFSKEDEKAAEQRLWQMQRATEAVLTADGAVFTLLKSLGLKADMMAGHSAGEWIAMAASGVLDVGEFLGSLSRLDHMYRRLAEDSDIPRMVMFAVGAGRQKVAKIVDEIDCIVHVANDNCPNQVVIVVEPRDADRVTAEIQRRGIFIEKLAYDRGYHTRAFTYICEPLRKYFSEMAIRAPHTPVYCCTTAQLYSNDSTEILDHVANTFTRPLLFRQTIEAMYDAGARIFVEAGPRGNLTAFVDDILRGRPHLAVAIDQYRRPALTTLNISMGLLTALHVPLDLNPLYARRSPRLLTLDPAKDRIEDRDTAPGTMQVSLGSPRLEAPNPLPAGAAIHNDDALPDTEYAHATEAPDAQFEPVTESSFQETMPARLDLDDFDVLDAEQSFSTAGPYDAEILDSHFQLMESFLQTQESVMRAFLHSGSAGVETTALQAVAEPIDLLDQPGEGVDHVDAAAGQDVFETTGYNTETVTRSLTAGGAISEHIPGEQVTIVCEIDPEEHLYLADHCFDPVGSDWDLERNGLYFVPLTVSLAFMTEVAAVLSPGSKVVGAKNVQASRWIDVEKGGPRVTISVSAKRIDEQRISVRILPHRPDGQSGTTEVLAEATVLVASSYPAAPNAGPLDLVNARKPHCTGPELYSKRRMFHGPSFHGVVALDAMADNGLLAKIDTLPRNNLLRSNPNPFFHVDPFLLDAAGQLVGYWPIEYCSEGFVLFPIRIEELILYREPLTPGERSVCRMSIRNMSPRQFKADLDLIRPDGTLWMRVAGWEDWRFYWPKEFYEFWRYPNKGENARSVNIRPPGKFFDVVCRRVEPFGEIDKDMWENLWAHIILSRRELDEYRSITDRTTRAKWMCERAVIKDAVRAWMRGRHKRDIYPADVEVDTDSTGALTVAGLALQDLPEPLSVSVANDGAVTVAAAGSCGVGVEIESVVHWEGGTDNARLHKRERVLVSGTELLDRDEWFTRLWCAKKAAARTFGPAEDHSGSLNHFVVESINPETGDITVAGQASNGAAGSSQQVVSTVRDGDYIIALAAKENHDRPR